MGAVPDSADTAALLRDVHSPRGQCSPAGQKNMSGLTITKPPPRRPPSRCRDSVPEPEKEDRTLNCPLPGVSMLIEGDQSPVCSGQRSMRQSISVGHGGRMSWGAMLDRVGHPTPMKSSPIRLAFLISASGRSSHGSGSRCRLFRVLKIVAARRFGRAGARSRRFANHIMGR
jgi:hypothetical protein